MKKLLTKVLFGVFCALTLTYLALANARGYIPFTSSLQRSFGGTANHFHK
jgi:hypothetical protein